MKLSRDEKKALKEQIKKEKLERKEQLRQEKLQKKLQKNGAWKQTNVDNIQNSTVAQNIQQNNVDLELLDTQNSDSYIDANEPNTVETTNNFDEADISQNQVDNIGKVETPQSSISNDSVIKNGEILIDENSQTQQDVDFIDDDASNAQPQNGANLNNDKTAENQDFVEPEAPKQKVGFFKKIKNALKKTKESISNKIEQIFGKGELTDEFFEDLEDILISSDLGVETSSDIIEEMRERIKKDKLKTAEDVKAVLREIISDMIDIETPKDVYPKVSIIVGVNGVGKTTTIGKLANYYKSLGKKVVVVAGDTFRAAASDQLTEWAKRVDVKIIKQAEGADSASVVFDGISFAKSKGFDVVLVDTAGRLHNKVNLMDELTKVNRVAMKNWDEADFERLIVIDATTGQNAVNQVREFNEAVDLDGIILTKLDGSAKGGIVVSICNEFEIPVKFVGVGEGMDDLVPFNAQEFVEGII